MAANIYPIYPKAPAVHAASLGVAAVITPRTNIVGVVGLTALTPVSVEGKRIDQITVKGSGTTVATIVSIWHYDGVTSRLIDEIDVAAAVPTNTLDSVLVTKLYNNLILPPTHQLYISQTVLTPVNVFAHGGDY